MSTYPHSGCIWWGAGEVHYKSLDCGSWSFPVADRRVFGEHSTDHGPMIDDWFMAFATSSARGWFEAVVSLHSDSAAMVAARVALRHGRIAD